MLSRVRFSLILVGCLLLVIGCAKTKSTHQDSPAEVAASTLTKVGAVAPDFSVPMLGEGSFDLSGQKGKVVLVNWWATWCPPCVEEMPLLQSLVWDRFKGANFVMVAISRAETPAVVSEWIQAKGFTFPVAIDADRSSYSKYASAYIPRSYVIGPDGKILFQSQGYEQQEFADMIETIATALGGGI